MGRSGHVSVFFFSLPLFELEIKDTTDTIKGPIISPEGGHGFFRCITLNSHQ
jgi:hypothetical protein